LELTAFLFFDHAAGIDGHDCTRIYPKSEEPASLLTMGAKSCALFSIKHLSDYDHGSFYFMAGFLQAFLLYI
jgi:hypothetical protein